MKVKTGNLAWFVMKEKTGNVNMYMTFIIMITLRICFYYYDCQLGITPHLYRHVVC